MISDLISAHNENYYKEKVEQYFASLDNNDDDIRI